MKIFQINVSKSKKKYCAELYGTGGKIFGNGVSSNEAIGACVLEHPEIFKIPGLHTARYPDGRFRVYLPGKPKVYGEGASKEEAVGTCIQYNFKIFHIRVEP